MARRAAAPRPQAPGTASVAAPLLLLLQLTLLLFLATAPAGAAAPSTVMDLWKWWPEGGKSAPAGAKPAYSCLADAFSNAPRDRKVHSQFGEDGIIEAIFDCIGALAGNQPMAGPGEQGVHTAPMGGAAGLPCPASHPHAAGPPTHIQLH